MVCIKQTKTKYHPIRSPRGKGQLSHAIAGRPALLTPSIDPRLGVVSLHQELHRCALNGFLGPPSGTISLTRILHHHANIIILQFIFQALLKYP